MKRGLLLTTIMVMMVGMFFAMYSASSAQNVQRHVVIVPGGWEVTVMPGDTLSYLCDRYLGDSLPSTCQATADLNGVGTEEVLKPGKKLFFSICLFYNHKRKEKWKVCWADQMVCGRRGGARRS